MLGREVVEVRHRAPPIACTAESVEHIVRDVTDMRGFGRHDDAAVEPGAVVELNRLHAGTATANTAQHPRVGGVGDHPVTGTWHCFHANDDIDLREIGYSHLSCGRGQRFADEPPHASRIHLEIGGAHPIARERIPQRLPVQDLGVDLDLAVGGHADPIGDTLDLLRDLGDALARNSVGETDGYDQQMLCTCDMNRLANRRAMA
jgi:hypothetical protein